MKITFSFFFLLIFCSTASAQFHREKFFSTTLNAAVEYLPNTAFDTVKGTYNYTTAFLDFNMPLWTKAAKASEPGTFRVNGILLNTGVEYSWQRLSEFYIQHNLIDAHLGVTGILYPGKKHLFMLNANANFFEDNFTIKNGITFRYDGFFMYSLKSAHWLRLNFGAAYTYKFGKGQPVPLLGAVVKTKKFALKILLPLSVNAKYGFSKKFEMSLFLHPDGSVNNYANDKYVTYPSVIQYRQQQYKLGLRANIRTTPNFKISPEIGVAGNQSLAFSDQSITSNENFYKATLVPSAYFKATLTFYFGKQPQWGTSHATNYLLDNDVDDAVKLEE